MRRALFWVVMRLIVAVPYRRFGKAIGPFFVPKRRYLKTQESAVVCLAAEACNAHGIWSFLQFVWNFMWPVRWLVYWLCRSGWICVLPQRPAAHILCTAIFRCRGVCGVVVMTLTRKIGSTGRRTSSSVILSTISHTDLTGIEPSEVIGRRPTALAKAACSLLNVTAVVSTSGGAGYSDGLRLVCECSEASCCTSCWREAINRSNTEWRYRYGLA